MSGARTRWGTGHASRAGALLASMWVAACVSDEPGIVDVETPVDSLVPSRGIVSNPIATSSVSMISGASGVSSPALADADEVVFVSLQPGTVVEGSHVVVTHTSSGLSVSAALVGGGFDPVALPASVGDTLEFRVLREVTEIDTWREVVPPRKPPIVVRTYPPRGKRDVPVASSMLVVFSEPMAPTVLDGAAIRLRRNGTFLPGTVQFTDGTQLSARFVPDAPLADSTTYELVVTRESRDLDGDAIATEEVVEFATAVAPPGASIRIEQTNGTGDSLTVGERRWLVATAWDASGNALSLGTSLFTWASSDTTRASVIGEPYRALLTGRAPGEVDITVTAGGVTGHLVLRVQAAGLAFLVQPTSTTAGAVMTPAVRVAVLDPLGGIDATAADTISIARDLWAGDGKVSGTLTKVAVGGIATFDDLSVDKPRVAFFNGQPVLHTLVASATGRRSATSAPFDVQPGGAAVLSFRGLLPDAIAALRFAYTLGVIAQDSLGNEADFAGTITLSIGSNPSGGTLSGITSQGGYSEFNDLRIDRPGVGYTLVATAPGLQPAVTPPFDVVAASDLIAFGSGSYGLGVVSSDGHGAARYVSRPLGSFYEVGGTEPSWSPDGSRLVFHGHHIYGGYNAANDSSLFVINADGSDITRLGNGAFPAWSPDGGRIAFVQGHDFNLPQTSRIYIMNADGSAVAFIADGYFPTWSPDGTRMAFTRWLDTSQPPGLFVMNSDGTGIQRLADISRLSRAAWSPDGTRIAFSCTDHPLCTIEPDGTRLESLLTASELEAFGYGCALQPTWSPDATKVAFEADCSLSQLDPRVLTVLDLRTSTLSLVAPSALDLERGGLASVVPARQFPAWRPRQP